MKYTKSSNLKILTATLLISTLFTSSTFGADIDRRGPVDNPPLARAHPRVPRVAQIGPEVRGRYQFDGTDVSQMRVQIHVNRDGRRASVAALAEEFPGHEGRQIQYVELFDIGNGLPARLSGEYGFRGDLEERDCLRGREPESLIYSDGVGGYHLLHTSQEEWEREKSHVGAFVASSNTTSRLSLLEGIQFQQGEAKLQGPLPKGVYQIQSVQDIADAGQRQEIWKRFRSPAREEIVVTSQLGCAAIPGMGAFAPRYVQEDQALADLLRTMGEIEDKVAPLALHSKADGAVLAMGRTGRGKSTLLHLLARKQVNVIETLQGLRLEVDPHNLLPDFKIEHGLVAGTKLPVVWHDRELDRLLADSPGVGDPAGPVADLLNAYSIYTLLKSRQSFRVVSVVREADLARGEYKDFLNQLVGFFGDDETLYESASLIVTQQRDVRDLPAYLRRIADTVEDVEAGIQLDPRARALLRFFADNPQHVSYVPYPEEIGEYICPTIDAVEDTIGRSEYRHHAPETLRVALSEGATTLVRQLAGSLNDQIEEWVKGPGTQRIVNYARGFADSHHGTLAELRAALTTYADHLATLKDTVALTATDFLRGLGATIDVNDVRRSVDRLDFFSQILPEIRHEVGRWKDALDSTIVQLRTFFAVPTVHYEDHTLTLQGPLVGTSDIAAVSALADHAGATSIRAYAYDQLFIDHDLVTPGQSVSLLAPQWTVVGDRLVNLTGSAGARGADGAIGTAGTSGEEAQPGGDGQAGNSGQNGGNFFGKGFHFTGLDHLSISTDGGAGGNGGNGGSGGQGAAGADGNIERVTSEERFKSGGIRGNKFFYRDHGKGGKPGAAGGRAGAAGAGGNPGTAILEGYPWVHQTTPGAGGAEGTVGQGGLGGAHGKNCKGVLQRDLEQIVSGDMTPGEFILTFLTRVPVYHYTWQALPEPQRWEVGRGYEASDGRAASGAAGEGLVAGEAPSAQTLLNPTQVLQDYRGYYIERAMDRSTSALVRVFPGLFPEDEGGAAGVADAIPPAAPEERLVQVTRETAVAPVATTPLEPIGEPEALQPIGAEANADRNVDRVLANEERLDIEQAIIRSNADELGIPLDAGDRADAAPLAAPEGRLDIERDQ